MPFGTAQGTTDYGEPNYSLLKGMMKSQAHIVLIRPDRINNFNERKIGNAGFDSMTNTRTADV